MALLRKFDGLNISVSELSDLETVDQLLNKINGTESPPCTRLRTH